MSSTTTTDDNGTNGAKAKEEDANTPPTPCPSGYQHIHEGQINMMYPKSENSVFYNPVQVQNRDLSVFMLGAYAERRMERIWTARKKKEVRKRLLLEEAMEANKVRETREEAETDSAGTGSASNNQNLMTTTKETKEERRAKQAQFERRVEHAIQKEKESVNFTALAKESSNPGSTDGMTVLDALAASGLRSLRYWKEVPGVRTVVVNDLDPVAVELARENVERNGFLGDLIRENGDAKNDSNNNNNNNNNHNNNDINNNSNEEDSNNKSTTTTTTTTPPPALTPHHLRPPGIQLQCGDATHEMYLSRLSPHLHPTQCNPTQLLHQKPQYDVIDLDPYGSAAPFLDAAVQSIVHGGLLAVTCTDMAALGGSHPETCYGRYGAMPLQRVGYLQELALRILLYHLSVVAGRHGRCIRPVLSVGMAFYVRVFVEVYDDKAGVNNLSLNHGLVFQSTQCSSFHVTPMATNEFVQSNNKPGTKNVYRNGRGPYELGEAACRETGATYKIGGPCWTGPLHDMDIVNDAISRLEAAKDNNGIHPNGGAPMFPLHTATTLHGLLVTVSEELPDVPLYHCLPSLCSTVNTTTIPMVTFRAALANAGYRCSAYHKEPTAVKTDAPNHVVWDIIRAWCKDHPPTQKKESRRHRKGESPGSSEKSLDKESTEELGGNSRADVATKILSKEIGTKVDFTIPPGFGQKKKARRYAQNPEANWGPKKAASGKNKRKQSDDCDTEDMGEPGNKNSKQE